MEETVKTPEELELEKARELLLAKQKENAKKCQEEIQVILNKYGCNLTSAVQIS